jgi:biopolymer transport protein ExbB
MSADHLDTNRGELAGLTKGAVSHNRGHINSLHHAEDPLLSIIQAAGWPIWPLLICSVLALTLIIERLLSLQTTKIAPTNLLDEVLQVTRSGLPPADVIDKLEANSALGEVLASGLRVMQAQSDCSAQDMQAAFENTGRQVAHRLERYLSALATIASVAPLMGLFGTVVGMIEIFGAQAPGAATSGSNPAELAHGISVALYNTAFGLIIAIPALIFWRYFRARVDAYVLTLELASERLLRQLNTKRPS